MKPRTLDLKVIEILNFRAGDEIFARHFYEQAASWCRAHGYDNAAAYYEKEALDEGTHLGIIRNYLADWGDGLNLETKFIPKEFASLQDVIEQQYGIEQALGEKYEADAITVFPICQMAYQFLQQFIKIQNDSIIEAATLYNKMQNYLPADPKLALFDSEVFEG